MMNTDFGHIQCMFSGRSFINRSFISRSFVYLFLLSVLLVSGCASLPKDVQRNPSFTLQDTSDTKLHSVIQPLVKANPEKSGFHALSDGIDAYATRVLLVDAAEKSINRCSVLHLA